MLLEQKYTMNSLDQKKHKFLLVWDNTGLECIYDLGAWEQRKVWSALSEKPMTDNPPHLDMLIMRAQANHHRHYEIYILETIDVDRETIVDMFKHHPQNIVDLVRSHGHQLYSDRATSQPVIV